MLDTVTVLDVTQVVSGSFASMTLADMGADVMKIERPTGGDVGRHNPPYVDDFSSYFASVNRNKRSVSFEPQERRRAELFLKLAEDADVVVENFRPGAMERFGIDYEAVAERNPKIIYCSISGFGQEGPYAEYPALDIIAQAMSGNMSITGPPDSKPYRSGIPIADIAGSMYAVQGILGALFRRERTGEGQYVDVSMLDCMLSWLTVRAGYTFATDEPYPRMGNKLTSLSPTVSSKQQIHTSRSSSFRTITGKSCVPLSVALSSRRTTGFRRPTSDAKTGTNSNQFWKTNQPHSQRTSGLT